MVGRRRKRTMGKLPVAPLVTIKTIRGQIGRDRYVVKQVRRNPYLYLRRYEGSAGHAKPVYRDVYLGPVPKEILGDPDRLGALASARRRVRSRLPKGKTHAKG